MTKEKFINNLKDLENSRYVCITEDSEGLLIYTSEFFMKILKTWLEMKEYNSIEDIQLIYSDDLNVAREERKWKIKN